MLFNVISRTLVKGVLPLCRKAVVVFYNPSRLGNICYWVFFYNCEVTKERTRKCYTTMRTIAILLSPWNLHVYKNNFCSSLERELMFKNYCIYNNNKQGYPVLAAYNNNLIPIMCNYIFKQKIIGGWKIFIQRKLITLKTTTEFHVHEQNVLQNLKIRLRWVCCDVFLHFNSIFHFKK